MAAGAHVITSAAGVMVSITDRLPRPLPRIRRGRQGPILAAAGANVTVFDASEKQLLQDRIVADRNGLELEAIQGDMADLSCFEDSTFDLFLIHALTAFPMISGPCGARPNVSCVREDLSSVVS